MNSFWHVLPKPFFVLAPMEGVTDTVFRQVMVRTGKPDVMFTEFTGVEQIFSRGFLRVLQNLEYQETERPLVAQFWGITPELFYQAGELALGLGFDGVDINMGCPDKSVIKPGGGSALVNNPNLARELIRALREGVRNQIPVSVKIRLGYDKNVISDWAAWLLESEIDALSVHGRTAVELSGVPADWEAIGRVVEIRNHMKLNTRILGNGDVLDLEDAQAKVSRYGVDGVMFGRGVFQNPWLFSANPDKKRSKSEKLDILQYHIHLWQEVWGETKHYDRLKRFYKIYLSGFKGSAALRDRLMRTNSLPEALAIINPTPR